MSHRLAVGPAAPSPYGYTVQVECLQAGQPRAYADSLYEYRITFTSTSRFMSRPQEETVRNHLRAVHPFKMKGEAEWWEDTLQELRELEPGVWYALIVRVYND